MRITLAVAAVLALGGLLVLAASKASASVERGELFVRWMVVVFVTYAALIGLPAVAGF